MSNNELDSTMIEMISDFVDKIYNNGKKNSSKMNTIVFPCENIHSILDSENFTIIINYDFIKLNRFTIVSKCPIILKLIHRIKSAIIKIKKDILSISHGYKNLITRFSVTESEILINHFNIDYFYKLLVKFIRNLKKIILEITNLFTFVRDNFITTDRIINKYKSDIIDIQTLLIINISDMKSKLNDIN
jgi:hypothetical protein